MAHYLVRAKPRANLTLLKNELDRGEIARMRPFGSALDYSLKNARQGEGEWIIWEEEDYCSPPLAMERAAVLDRYFDNLSATKVEEGMGWNEIENLPSLWESQHD